MDDNNIFALLIQKEPAEAGLRSLGEGDGAFKLQCVESIPTAVARIGGGGVDAIVLDLSLRDSHWSDALGGFLHLSQAAPNVPVIVLGDTQDEGLTLRAMRAGAVD